MSLIYVAADHAGLALKDYLVQNFAEAHWTLIDLGTHSETRVDYPDYADRVIDRMRCHPESLGLLICGSGQGMCMRANKASFVRAALCTTPESARLAKEHNNANILCLGARELSFSLAEQILRRFLLAGFEGGRHLDRVRKLARPVLF